MQNGGWMIEQGPFKIRVHPEPQNVTYFGNRVTAQVIS